MQTNSLSSTSVTKIYINLETPEVVEIINKCIFLKFIIIESLINSIFYTISQNAINLIFSFKKFNDRNGKKHNPIQEIPKIHAKQFS